MNRKHLAGLRVVQKNLVYVVGLNPQIKEEDLLRTLRGSQYFGQYGKIIKIVVSKSKDNHNPQSLGVHVTFARKEDAARCIVAVDGSENGGRTLRYAPPPPPPQHHHHHHHHQQWNWPCGPSSDRDRFSEPSTGRPNTARHTFATRTARTRAACSCTNLARRRIALPDRICRP